jgi:hypothetical protein
MLTKTQVLLAFPDLDRKILYKCPNKDLRQRNFLPKYPNVVFRQRVVCLNT